MESMSLTTYSVSESLQEKTETSFKTNFVSILLLAINTSSYLIAGNKYMVRAQ